MRQSSYDFSVYSCFFILNISTNAKVDIGRKFKLKTKEQEWIKYTILNHLVV